LKKLHLLIVQQFAKAFLPTFFVVLFILLMQFIWLYIDDLAGKGLSVWVIAQLMFYFSASIIPMALPLSILLASIMTFGNLGETYELVAAKAAGVSIWRMFMPLIVVMVGLGLFGFFTSNVLIPKANLKKGALLYDIKQQKPTLLIQDGVFFNGIEGISMRVSKRDAETGEMKDIVIYDQRQGGSKPVIITAESGKMIMGDDKRFLFFTLYNGSRYEEMERQQDYERKSPHTTFTFKEEQIVFDLQAFKFTRTDENLFKNHYQMLDVVQLNKGYDSLSNVIVAKNASLKTSLDAYFHLNDSMYGKLKSKAIVDAGANDSIVSHLIRFSQQQAVASAVNNARSAKGYVDYSISDVGDTERTRIRFDIEWHRKFTLSVACLVMFFIGAPFGAIVRKGGFGMPVVISVVFYIIYHILSITGEKMVKTESSTAFSGMWMAVMVLAPVGMVLTYLASTDSGLFDKASWKQAFNRLIRLGKK
jgi:lipopolysaccharide export system permease protein